MITLLNCRRITQCGILCGIRGWKGSGSNSEFEEFLDSLLQIQDDNTHFWNDFAWLDSTSKELLKFKISDASQISLELHGDDAITPELLFDSVLGGKMLQQDAWHTW